ncbi:hypothetical protein FRC00_007633 [Tulasnella sp. 408]|nr:hypothetical protein FRC00_007633 [Tulasnella sp. 408]
MADKKQKLVLSILDFLSQSISDGTVKSDDHEGLEVAIQCIGEAFGVDPNDSQQRERLSIAPATLPNIFDVYLKTKERVGSTAAPAASASASASTSANTPSAADKAAADKLKQAGNSHMTAKDYAAAIESYTKAIALDATNPVYFSNRAAAHSSAEDHYSAIEDARKALELDPNFTKAYSRMGHAYFCLEEYDEALSAYQKGLALDPNNANLKSGVENSRQKLNKAGSSLSPEPSARSAGAGAGAGGMPDLASLAGMFGGGGGGGGGGMPDLAAMMNNPQLMAMAEQMMANGGMERLMSNPSVRQMAERMQSGGGMPSMSEMMSDPTLRDL